MVPLGEIECPSGRLLIIDPGLLKLWSHRPPVGPRDGVLEPHIEALSRSAVDLRFEGPDASRVAALWGRQRADGFLFDIPAAAVPALEKEIAALCAKQKLNARIVPLAERVAHRERLECAVRDGAGQFQFEGVPAVAVRAVPPGVWTVEGDAFADGRWQSVRVRFGESGNEAQQVGVVGVDMARLLMIDADAVGDWEEFECSDGLADFVFWGRDAAQVASQLRSPSLGNNEFGWKNLTIERAIAFGEPVEAMRGGALKFMTDFRPHTDQYRLLEQIRASETGSGVVIIGGFRACGFSTSWGDGLFPVECGWSGRELRWVKIELQPGPATQA